MLFFKNKKNRSEKLLIRRDTPQLKKRFEERRITFSRLIFYILIILFFVVAIYVLFFSSFLQINSLSINGVRELPYENLINEAASFYKGNYLKFIPKNNFILLSEKNIEEDLVSHFKKIKAVNVKKIFPNSLAISIEERSSLILWCSGGPCYIVDENGCAYTGIDLESPEVKENNLIKLIDESARPVTIGEKIIDADYVSFLLDLKEELTKNLINTGDDWVTPSAVAEEVEIKDEGGWNIYFSGNYSADAAVKTLQIFLNEEIPEDKRNELDYVDLRAENKVFYKLKEGEAVQPQIQTNTNDLPKTPEVKDTNTNKKKG